MKSAEEWDKEGKLGSCENVNIIRQIQKDAQPLMKKFEYTSFYVHASSPKSLTEQLTTLIGKDGWEVVQIDKNNNDHDVLAKREILQEQPWKPFEFRNVK